MLQSAANRRTFHRYSGVGDLIVNLWFGDGAGACPERSRGPPSKQAGRSPSFHTNWDQTLMQTVFSQNTPVQSSPARQSERGHGSDPPTQFFEAPIDARGFSAEFPLTTGRPFGRMKEEEKKNRAIFCARRAPATESSIRVPR